MKQENILRDKFGTAGGFKVPEGYFEEFYIKMDASLPAYPEAPKAQPMSRWNRVKPYVYLAAMFAGIWCMMQMFHHVSDVSRINLDNPPEQMKLAMAQQADELHILDGRESFYELELESDMTSYYQNIEEFERDFGYQITPEYQDISLSN